MNAQTLIASSRPNSTYVTRRNFFELRKQITTFLFQVRKLIYSRLLKCNKANEIISPLDQYFGHLSALPIADILHNTHSSIGNEVSQPSYQSTLDLMKCSLTLQSNSPAHHLMHGHMEWRWFHLTIKLKIANESKAFNQMNESDDTKSNEVEEILRNFIHDLLLISASKFNKLSITELPTKTPFVCVCNKELWLMIQLLIEKYSGGELQSNNFWFYFNNALKSYREHKGKVVIAQVLISSLI